MGIEKLDKRTGGHAICEFVVVVMWRTFLQELR